ncbi:hypothetical protein GCM10009801_68010 [Streptomyces albiaxialis]|uniref:DUF1963 domain-containing protein n=1 Tax=Streptomyces albiaxialis TaxID=329523 RepID=A0ABN2WRE8_9ACTN
MSLEARWRAAAEVTDVLADPPRPPVVGFEGYVPEPCVLHPEQVRTYPFAGLLPEELRERIYAWEDQLEEEGEEDEEDEGEYAGAGGTAGSVGYQYDLSIPPGWRVGGYASWHTTDPARMDCASCATPMELLLTVDSSEWDGGSASWRPVEEAGLHPHPHAVPTQVIVGRAGELNLFACPSDPAHPHRWSIQ